MKSIVLAATCALGFTACVAQPGPSATPVASPTSERQQLISPLPSPAAASPTSTPLARQDHISGKGSVVGRAVLPPGRAGHPSFIVPGELYLGSFVPAADPKLPPAVAVEPGGAPHAIVNQATGEFRFNNVTPGTYALVMISFSLSYVFEKPNGGGSIIVRIEPDKVTDLGDVTLQ